MEITYLGHSCFKITGKKINVLMDPFEPDFVGMKISKHDADVVTISHKHNDHNYLGATKTDDYLLLDSPGEYEVKESEFIGVEASHGVVEGVDKGKVTMFAFDVDGVKVAHLGDLGTELTGDQLDKMDGVDVLMIPVGGFYTIDPKTAVKVIAQIEPKIVLPMHYRESQKIANIEKLSTLDDFLKEMSVTPVAQDKLKVLPKDLPEELEVVVLKA